MRLNLLLVVLAAVLWVATVQADCDDKCKTCGAGDACSQCIAGAGHSVAMDTHSPCRPCADPLCTACADDYSVCTECLNGNAYLNNANQCERCTDAGCMRCPNSADQCTNCGLGFKLPNGAGACEPCNDPHCLRCDAVDGTCSVCADGMYQWNDACHSCPPGCWNCYLAEISQGVLEFACTGCKILTNDPASNCTRPLCDIPGCYHCDETVNSNCAAFGCDGIGYIGEESATATCAVCPNNAPVCGYTNGVVVPLTCPAGMQQQGALEHSTCDVCPGIHVLNCPFDSSVCESGWTGPYCDIPCPANCQLCEEGSDACIACVTGYTTADPTEGPACVPEFNTPHCVQWEYSDAPMVGVCGSCEAGYGLNRTGGVGFNAQATCEPCTPPTSDCVQTKTMNGIYGAMLPYGCEDGYTVVRPTTTEVYCASCQVEGCSACSIEGSATIGACQYCMSGWYRTTAATCVRCPAECGDCALEPDGTTIKCLSCATGTGFRNATATECVRCEIEHCEVCVNAGTRNEKCGRCEANYFFDPFHQHCFTCRDHCSQCTDASTCAACEAPYTLVNNRCVMPSTSTTTTTGAGTTGDASTTAASTASGLGALVSSTGGDDAGAGKLEGGPVAGIAIAAAVVGAVLAAIITAFIMSRMRGGRRGNAGGEAPAPKGSKKGSAKKASAKKASAKKGSAKKASAKKKASASSEDASASSVDLSHSSN